MTLATEVRIIGDVSPEGLFAKCREIIGIPETQPMSIERFGDWVETRSKPGGFNSALDVFVSVNGPSTAFEHDRYCSPHGAECLCDERRATPVPAVDAIVRLDTTYGFRQSTHPTTCSELHRHITRQLGEWLTAQGADWWGHDEFTGEWHHAIPVPVTQ